jgi:hypothetical protein
VLIFRMRSGVDGGRRAGVTWPYGQAARRVDGLPTQV